MEKYYQAVEAAKDIAVVYGLNSEQYKKAIEKMKIEYDLAKKPIEYKILNTLAKWQTKKQRY